MPFSAAGRNSSAPHQCPSSAEDGPQDHQPDGNHQPDDRYPLDVAPPEPGGATPDDPQDRCGRRRHGRADVLAFRTFVGFAHPGHLLCSPAPAAPILAAVQSPHRSAGNTREPGVLVGIEGSLPAWHLEGDPPVESRRHEEQRSPPEPKETEGRPQDHQPDRDQPANECNASDVRPPELRPIVPEPQYGQRG